MATDRHQAQSYPLRMPEDLKSRVTAEAQTAGRSVHQELIARLQQSFQPNRELEFVKEMSELSGALDGWKQAFGALNESAHARVREYLEASRAGIALAQQLSRDLDVALAAVSEVDQNLLPPAAREALAQIRSAHAGRHAAIQEFLIPEPPPLSSAIRELAASDGAVTWKRVADKFWPLDRPSPDLDERNVKN